MCWSAIGISNMLSDLDDFSKLMLCKNSILQRNEIFRKKKSSYKWSNFIYYLVGWILFGVRNIFQEIQIVSAVFCLLGPFFKNVYLLTGETKISLARTSSNQGFTFHICRRKQFFKTIRFLSAVILANLIQNCKFTPSINM